MALLRTPWCSGSVSRLAVAMALAGSLAVLAQPAAGQSLAGPYADYFLVKSTGEVCTLCDVMVLCGPGDAPPVATGVPEDGSFTLYHVRARPFWGQVSTIWTVFAGQFRRGPPPPHSRPVTIHTVTDGTWSAPAEGQVLMSLEPGRLEFSDGRAIDRTNRRWISGAGDPAAHLGYCERLPLWESLAVVDDRSPGPAEGG